MAALKIPVTKAGASIEVESDNIPEDMFKLVVEEGLKVILNKRMSKIMTKGLEGDDLTKAHSAAMSIASENLESLLASKTKRGRATTGASKVPGVVMTEARRLAKEVVKNEIRNAGMKVSHVEASVITAAANELIASDPSYVETATANIEARTAKAVSINIASLVHESPKLKAAAEKAKADRKANAPLSAKQAGKVAPRKAQPTHQATH